ncbi:MAG: hypothetical protein C0410_04745 [Anaerolinea sp.]|nr:hypothetical protein [Anaerolinea sp.]
MFIFLSKFLPLFFYPLGLACVFTLAALFFWKKRNFAKILLLLAFAILFIGGNRYIANSIARSLEGQYDKLGPVQSVDLIVILGGGTEPEIAPRPMTEVNAAGDRIIYAAKLYQENPESMLLLSGGDIEFLDQSSSTPAGDMASLLMLMGVPESAMILQDQSQNTYEDALYSCEKIKAAGYKNVVLVTSAMHMPRSMKLFAKQGCTVLPAPTDFTITETAWRKTWHPSFEEFIINLVPSYSNLSQVTKSMKEYIGMLVYRLNRQI